MRTLVLPENWTYEPHIPHGSGDAEWRIIDAGSDNHDVIAIVDPNMVMGDPESHARLIAAAPMLESFAETIANFRPYTAHETEGWTLDQLEDAVTVMNEMIEKARELIAATTGKPFPADEDED